MTRALKDVAGVSDVQVDLEKHQALVKHAGADMEAMKAAVDDAGYEVVSAS